MHPTHSMSRLKPCPHCGHVPSRRRKRCSQCSYLYPNRVVLALPWVAALLIVIVVAILSLRG